MDASKTGYVANLNSNANTRDRRQKQQQEKKREMIYIEVEDLGRGSSRCEVETGKRGCSSKRPALRSGQSIAQLWI